MRISGITATTIFGEERADRYINQLSAFFCFGVLIISVLPVLNWGNTYWHYPLNDICFIFCRLILKLLLSVY